MNKPVRVAHESNKHFLTKIRLCEMVDPYFEQKVVDKKLEVFTWYEWTFSPIKTSIGEKAYSGDIVSFFVDKSARTKYLIDTEIDGIINHSTRREQFKNRVRDMYLQGGVKLEKAWLPCYVKRFSAFMELVPDDVIVQELDQFYLSLNGKAL